MKMQQGVHLKPSQQLTMTPQLQQAIRLLQLSSCELRQEVEQAMENNPFLEAQESVDETQVIHIIEHADTQARNALAQKKGSEERPAGIIRDEIYTANIAADTDVDVDELPEYQHEIRQTLRAYLTWQAGLIPFTDTDAAIATSIIDAVDETGYLTALPEEILDAIGNEQVTLDEVQAVLKLIQHFDPPGVAARNLRDCLLMQLSQYDANTPCLKEACLVVKHYLELVGQQDYRTLLRLSCLKEKTLKGAITLIQSLNPYPCLTMHVRAAEPVVPDIMVHKSNGCWVVELNNDSILHIRINQQYASLQFGTCSDRDGQFIRHYLQEAQWLVKSLHSRNQTLLKVAACIVEQQRDFFEHGEAFMKPMIMADIAQRLDMHKSTISRVITQKFLHSSRGTFALNYFLSSHIHTKQGAEASSSAIRALVKKLVSEEDKTSPLSDSKLTTLLYQQGMIIARRTITKYRESLSIPPSGQRKQ